MRSAVNAGVLSLVIEQPSYGGEIGRRFEERYDGLLSSRPQHIYKALDELRLQGLVEQIVLDDGSGVGQHVRGYRATAMGARAYRSWLRSPIQVGSRTRHEVMIRLASTRPDDGETAAFLLDAYERAVLALARRHPVRCDSVIDRLLDEEAVAKLGPGEGHFDYTITKLALLPGAYHVSASVEDRHTGHIYDGGRWLASLDVVPHGAQLDALGYFGLDGTWCGGARGA